MAGMNQKDLRIVKLHRKGLSTEQIARHLGYKDMDEAEERIEDALLRNGLLKPNRDGELSTVEP